MIDGSTIVRTLPYFGKNAVMLHFILSQDFKQVKFYNIIYLPSWINVKLLLIVGYSAKQIYLNK